MNKLERFIIQIAEFFTIYILLDFLRVVLESVLDGGPQASNADAIIEAVIVLAYMRWERKREERE